MSATRAVWAPGRVNLIGEHTDYSGGLVLPAAISLGIRLDWRPSRSPGRIVLSSDRSAETVDLAVDAGPVEATGWGRYVAAVAAELAALGRAPVGIAGSVSSDLPAGAGLSSSAALEVAVALALCEAADLRLDRLELARLCQRAEHRAVGVPCGIMDQAASLLGVAGHAILIDTDSLAYESVPLPEGVALAIVDSGVEHTHESSGYAQRRAELERATAALGGLSPASLTPARADELIASAGVDEIAARRLRHVVGENERVRQVVAGLRASPPDLAALGELFEAGHESLRDLFEVSTPELDLLVELAREHGALAARMTGGGFGGSIVALVADDHAERLVARVLHDYGERTGIAAPRAFVTAAAAGAEVF